MTDHPRSRGVYHSHHTHPKGIRGSSPLARGLRRRREARRLVHRIIPARAGFTLMVSGSHGPDGDHPRSRGVYIMNDYTDNRGFGSSPLARGLRDIVIPVDRTIRIIPARAGFTGDGAHLFEGGGDHPRSRGVYRPLPSHGRIAGDHPRSRGVYRQHIPARGLIRGSSPLARGLLQGPPGAGPQREDHPRSRGVYPRIGVVPAGPVGSSPLARGLLILDLGGPQVRRIIPARAGFTADGIPGRLRGRDHPRSRGVYIQQLG